MPLYLFKCDDCDAEFEALQFRAAEAVACPSCESSQVTRGFGTPAKVSSTSTATNCRGDGPPCGASRCGRGGNGS